MATIATIASGDPQFSILLAAVGFIDAEKGTTYGATLADDTADLTVFAPTNAAFIQLATDLGFAGDTSDEGAVIAFLTTLGADLLETVVTYHISAGAQFAADIAAAGTVATLQGESIDAGELPTLGDKEPDLIDPSLVATDIAADNGVVHVIDRVLLPVDLLGNDAPTIGEIVDSSGTGFDDNGADFDLLREALAATGLDAVLGDASADLTAFAPTDAAFVGLSQTLGYDGDDEAGAFGYIVDALTLLSGGGDPLPLLQTILEYHVAGQSLQLSQVVAEGSVQTVQGGTLTVDGTSLVDADPDLPNPELIATDIQAANGIVHVIDGVLLPVDVLQSDGSNDVDFVIGDDGRDIIRTGRDNDLISGKGGRDFISAGRGDDLVLGGDGGDIVRGGNGHDTVKGEDGNDRLFGGRGKDDLHGGSGHDKIFGGLGHDTITGGEGNDRLIGGLGHDTFVFNEGDGHDRIIGFNVRQDKIDLSGFGFESFDDIAHLIDRGFLRTSIDLGDTEIDIYGIGARHLDEDNFIF